MFAATHAVSTAGYTSEVKCVRITNSECFTNFPPARAHGRQKPLLTQGGQVLVGASTRPQAHQGFCDGAW